MRNFVRNSFWVMVTVTLFFTVNCSNNKKKSGVRFWTAPNIQQYAYWDQTAQLFMEEFPQYTIIVEQIPESPSSEAGILNAIASKNPPAASENISRGFAAELAASGAIIPLTQLKEYNEIVQTRNMERIMEPWTLSDGNQYVFPLYSIPMVNIWRTDIIEQVGLGKWYPETYDDIYRLAELLDKEYNGEVFAYFNDNLLNPNWWERWFDFFMYYNAASGGKPFIENSRVVADESAVLQVLNHFYRLNNMPAGLLTQKALDVLERGVATGANMGSWKLNELAEKYPELLFGDMWDLAMPPVPSANMTPYTFSDTKGVVVMASASPSEREAIAAFLLWAFRQENDKRWFASTRLIPAREDILENPTFQDVFDENPALVRYAEALPYGIPAIDHVAMVDIQEAMGIYGIIPMLTDGIPPKESWERMKEEINRILEDSR